jgi:Family of unknown function (DUF6397)
MGAMKQGAARRDGETPGAAGQVGGRRGGAPRDGGRTGGGRPGGVTRDGVRRDAVRGERTRQGATRRDTVSGQGAARRDASSEQGGVRALLTLSRARDALGLDYDEFDVAVQIGEIRTVTCGPRTWKVPPEEVDRLRAEAGHPQPLLDRVRLVASADAAKELGIGRERFVRLARAGYVRPVRWYVNRYRALVWMYPARELPALAEQSPALLHGPLPEGLREAVAQGEDERARGWRARRVAQLVRDAYDPWDEAAVWAALLGPEIIDAALPDPYERAQLRKLRAALPPGRTGPVTPEQVRELTTADHPDEIALGLVALADALGRARVLRPAPDPVGASPWALAPPPARFAPMTSAPLLATELASAEVPSGSAPSPQAGSAPRSAAPSPLEPSPGREPEPQARPVARRGLRRLLARGRRSGDVHPAGGSGSADGRAHSSPTSVSRITARLSSSEAARSTSAEMPQP